MKRLALALLLIPTLLGAQQRVHITPLSPADSSIKMVWNQVVACAGPTRDTSQTFDQIKFFERDTVIAKSGRVIKGEWVPPDTIYLTKGFASNSWVVAHEMLHHALNGPRNTAGDDPHVVGMAAFLGCGLAEFQEPKPNQLPQPKRVPGQDKAPPVSNKYTSESPLTSKLRLDCWQCSVQ
jgi:hypothetical protein